MRTRVFITMIVLLVFVLPAPLQGTHAQEEPNALSGQIVYTATDGNLYVLRDEMATALQITTDAQPGQRYLSPRWSPDGSLLAYCQENANQPPLTKLIFMRTGEWQPFALAEDVYCAEFPLGGLDWTPDGRKITYTRNFEYNPEPGLYPWSVYQGIWTVDILSGEKQELLPPGGPNPLIMPLWSPDQVLMRFYEIVFFEGAGVLQTWDSETGQRMNWLNSAKEVYPGYASWAPDGAFMVFDVASYAGFPGGGLYISAPDGSNIQKLFSDPLYAASHPIWSPKDNWVAFTSTNFSTNSVLSSSLLVIQTNGQNLQIIQQSEHELMPVVWSPEGSELLYGDKIDGGIDLYRINPSTGANALVGQAADWNADWSALPPPHQFNPESAEFMTIEDFPASSSVMLYVGPGYQLMLGDPSTGREEPLTESMRVAGFYPSPSGQRVVYGSTLLLLEFTPTGQVEARRVALPSLPLDGELTWSPDEGHLALKDENGEVWMVDLSGNALPIPDANGLPAWNADGSWVAYCDENSTLFVIGPDVPPKAIAQETDCQPSWSAAGNWLAYTELESASEGPNRVVLYDAEQDSARALVEGAALDSWSPDGRLVAVRKDNSPGYGANAYTIIVVDPAGENQIAVGNFQPSDTGHQGWANLPDVYIYGPYLIAPDLGSVSALADSLFAITPSGARLLKGIGKQDLVTLACARLSGGDQSMLGTFYLTGVPVEEKPGLWGWLSPDGEWTALYNYQAAGDIHQLEHCERAEQISLPPGSTPLEQAFSPDSRWHLTSLTNSEGNGELLLNDLTAGDALSLPAVPNPQAVWLQDLVLPPPETYTMTGQVSIPNDGPVAGVEILVNGQARAQTNEAGEYSVGGLEAGDYNLQPRLRDYTFSPAKSPVRVPHSAMRVDFYAVPIPVDEPAAEVVYQTTPTPGVSGEVLVDSWDALVREDPTMLLGGLLLICLPVALVILVILLIRRLRRRSKSLAEPEPEVEEVLEIKALPMSADAEAETLMREGVGLAKQGKNKEAFKVLRKVVKLTPGNPSAWLWLGLTAARTGDRRSAERCFQRAKQLGHPKADQALEWLGSGS